MLITKIELRLKITLKEKKEYDSFKDAMSKSLPDITNELEYLVMNCFYYSDNNIEVISNILDNILDISCILELSSINIDDILEFLIIKAPKLFI